MSSDLIRRSDDKSLLFINTALHWISSFDELLSIISIAFTTYSSIHEAMDAMDVNPTVGCGRQWWVIANWRPLAPDLAITPHWSASYRPFNQLKIIIKSLWWKSRTPSKFMVI